MTITIHQAICGEQNKAWELLKTTFDDNAIARKIAFQTDLQDSPPSGMQWTPVIRGFLFGDYFLIIKTYPDNSPDVRNGRVFSHCLIINRTDLPRIFDLSPLISVFKSELDKAIQLEPITLTVEQQEPVILKDTLQLRFNKVIQSFVKFSNNFEPIIWVGQKHFEISVCKLWQLLSPAQRENFHFGINFNASEVIKEILSFVVIPENAESKFENKGFIIVYKEDSIELKEFSEQFLAGESNATGRIENFVSAIEASKPSLKEVSIIAKAVTTFENVEKETDLKLLNTLSNIVAKFSPESSKGTSFKERLVGRISLLVEKTNEGDVFLLRNFQTKSFRGSEKKLSTSIDKWVLNYLLDYQQNQKANYAPFIIQIAEAQQNNWLIKLVLEKIIHFISKIDETTSKIVWCWVTNDINIIKAISDRIENTRDAEKQFYESLPKTDEPTLLAVRAFALKRKWFRLHAVILKSQFDFEMAIKEQLKVDLEANSFEGVELITEDIKPDKLISFSVANGDKRLIQLSGKLCKVNTKLLGNIQIENSNWQDVWLAAINNGNSIFNGIKEPQKVTHQLFDLLINSKYVNEGLLEKVSSTDFANVLNYPNRSRIWSKLPPRVKDKFLEKTSGVLLRNLSDNSTYQIPTDVELSDYVVSQAISVFLYYNRNNIKSVLPIFNTYSQISEHILRDFVSNYSGKIDVVDATQLGQMTNRRGYSRVAFVIFQKAYSGKQYKVALAECYGLLDFITRGVALFSGLISRIELSADEWWDAFTQLCYTLYDEGPTQNKIWIQADGKGYDIETRGSGKEVWISALRKLRKNSCAGDITAKKLLKTMLEENKKNEELKTLKELWNKI